MAVEKTFEETQAHATKMATAYEKGQTHVSSVQQDIINFQILLSSIEAMKINGEPMPANSQFANHDEWMADVTASIKRYNSALLNLDEKVMDIIIYKHYIDTAVGA